MVMKQDGQIRCNRWLDAMQMTGQVECKQVVMWSAIPHQGAEAGAAAPSVTDLHSC